MAAPDQAATNRLRSVHKSTYTDRAPDAEIDASVLINLTELAGWLINPQISKPCCFMPSMKVTSKELDQMVHTYNR
jgi:hypothetical protein